MYFNLDIFSHSSPWIAERRYKYVLLPNTVTVTVTTEYSCLYVELVSHFM